MLTGLYGARNIANIGVTVTVVTDWVALISRVGAIYLPVSFATVLIEVVFGSGHGFGPRG